MTYEEIRNILEINGKESPVFMPNELFQNLQWYLEDSSHLAYAYSYMYLTHFLYRNCKYFNVPTLLDNNMLKEILGYSKNNRTMNYITMKKGLLTSLKYTEPTKDYPFSWEYTDKELSFLTYEDSRDYMDVLPPVPKMFFLNYPLLAMADERVVTRVVTTETGEKLEEEVEVRGSFFDAESTHSVDFKIFMFCMGKKDLGVVAFYLYSWLRHKNDIHSGYGVPLTELSKETGISRRTLNQYMDLLKGYRMITFRHNMECFSWTATKEERMANTYYTQSFDSFSKEYKPYTKMKAKTLEEYEEDRIKRKAEQEKNKKVNIPFSELPF